MAQRDLLSLESWRAKRKSTFARTFSSQLNGDRLTETNGMVLDNLKTNNDMRHSREFGGRPPNRMRHVANPYCATLNSMGRRLKAIAPFRPLPDERSEGCNRSYDVSVFWESLCWSRLLQKLFGDHFVSRWISDTARRRIQPVLANSDSETRHGNRCLSYICHLSR